MQEGARKHRTTRPGGNRRLTEVVPSRMITDRRPWSFLAALILTLAGCVGPMGAPSSVVPRTGFAIAAVAGPTCPVETLGDPACAPRPVAGAKVVILDAEGNEVATLVLEAQGSMIGLPAGPYVLRPQPAAGLMGTPAAVEVTVVDGTLAPVVLSYDTGIR